MKKWLIVVILVAQVLVAKNALAANFADLTVLERLLPEFIVDVYEGDQAPRWAMINLPVSTTTAISVKDWQGKGGTGKYVELRGIKRMTPWVDASLISKAVGNSFCQNLVLDLHDDSLGLGVNAPLEVEKLKGVLFGPRLKVWDITTYLTIAGDGTNPIYGVSYRKSGFALELAYAKDETKYARISKGIKTHYGLIVPEVRIQFKPTGNLYGLAIFFWPQ